MRNEPRAVPDRQYTALADADVAWSTGAPAVPSRRLPRTGRRNLVFDLPIAWRLTLGFLLAALLAALAAGVVGVERSQSLSRESAFYQTLLRNNTDLNAGDSYLQLMRLETQQIIDQIGSPSASTETLSAEEASIPRLEASFNAILENYVQHELLTPDQIALLDEGGYTNQAQEQSALASSVQRTWRASQTAQDAVLSDITHNQISAAEDLYRLQGQPTNEDTQSALRGLILFNGSLADGVRAAADVEDHNQLVTTIVAALMVFVTIGVVGWLISETLVRRLGGLRRVTQDIERGDLGSRVAVVGRDEIAQVSTSVNGMLDTIVGLLEETRRQRDALTSAAERLFSDMRVASAGDLRVSAAASSDPIGLLGNAFNLTLGRFRRFVLHTQANVDQLEVFSRQQSERADTFIAAVQALLRAHGGSGPAGAPGTLGATSIPPAPASPISPVPPVPPVSPVSPVSPISPAWSAWPSPAPMSSNPPSYPGGAFSSSQMGRGAGDSRPNTPGNQSDWRRWSQPIQPGDRAASDGLVYGAQPGRAEPPAIAQIDRARGLLMQLAREGTNQRARTVVETAEQIYLSAGRLSQITQTLPGARSIDMIEYVAQSLIQELYSLEALVVRLGSEAFAIQKDAGRSLTELDAALKQLANTVREVDAAPQYPSLSGQDAATGVPNPQTYDFVRLGVGFAQEMSSMSRRLRVIAQEMQAGVAPFHLDAADANASYFSPDAEYSLPQRPPMRSVDAEYGAYAPGSRPLR